MRKLRSGAIGLTALLAVAGAAAPVGAQDPVTISYLTHWGPDQVAQLEAVAAKFTEANPGINVEIRAVPFGDLLTTIKTQAASPGGPTVVGHLQPVAAGARQGRHRRCGARGPAGRHHRQLGRWRDRWRLGGRDRLRLPERDQHLRAQLQQAPLRGGGHHGAAGHLGRAARGREAADQEGRRRHHAAGPRAHQQLGRRRRAPVLLAGRIGLR